MKKAQKASPATPPSYYLSLALENVRCFKDKQTLDLSDGRGKPARWNVIMGNNGTGKTTLLQCLAMCEPTRAIISKQPIETEIIDNYDAFVPRSSKFEYLGPGTHLAQDWSFSVDIATGSLLSKNAKFTRTPNFGFRSFPRLLMSAHSQDLGGLICYGYGASRKQGKSSLGDDKNVNDRTLSLFEDRTELPNAEEWLLQLDYSAKSDPKKKALVRQRDRAKELLVEVLPDVEDITFATKSDRIGLKFKTPYGWVGQSELSLGYRTLIAWVVDLTRRLFERYPESVNPIAEPGVVLIDEIDLHLHPTWQRDILRFLSERFTNIQFIVTAHSPLIAQTVPSLNEEGPAANLIVLKQEGDHVVIRNDTESIRSWRVDQILASELFETQTYPESLEKILEERRNILRRSKLGKDDERRLEEIALQIGAMPTAETPRDIEAMDLIRMAAGKLK